MQKVRLEKNYLQQRAQGTSQRQGKRQATYNIHPQATQEARNIAGTSTT